MKFQKLTYILFFFIFPEYILTLAWETLSAFKPSLYVLLTQSCFGFGFCQNGYLINSSQIVHSSESFAARAMGRNQYWGFVNVQRKRKAK